MDKGAWQATVKKLDKTERAHSEKYFFENQAAAAAKSLQSCPTLCDPIDGSPPGSPATLEWVAISFSNA